jgi:hypothetical protein
MATIVENNIDAAHLGYYRSHEIRVRLRPYPYMDRRGTVDDGAPWVYIDAENRRVLTKILSPDFQRTALGNADLKESDCLSLELSKVPIVTRRRAPESISLPARQTATAPLNALFCGCVR